VEADTGDRSLPTIVLGGMRDLREEDTRRVDLQNILKASAKKDAGQDLRGLNWRGRVLAQDTPLACQSLTPGDGAPLLARRRKQNFDMNPVGSILGGSASNPNADLLRDWRDHVNARSIFQRAGESLTRVGTSLRDTAASLNPLKSESRDDMLGPRATLDGERFVMAQSAPTRSDAPVTVIAAANRADLRNAVDCLTDARVWSQARGRSASIDPTSGAVMSRAADDKSIVSIYPLTFENLRLVVATWLSLHMKSYVAATMAAAGLLAWATARLLERTRRSA
jgi:hypothetical protein